MDELNVINNQVLTAQLLAGNHFDDLMEKLKLNHHQMVGAMNMWIQQIVDSNLIEVGDLDE